MTAMENGFKENARIIGSCYLGLLVIGIAMTTIGPALPMIMKDLGLSLALGGTVLSGRAVGRFSGTPFGGILSDKYGRKPVILAGSLIMALGLALTGLFPGPVTLVLWSFVVGAGIGQVDGSLNALVAELSGSRKGFALNMLHVFFGLGALLGPLGAGFVLERTGNWRLVMYMACACCLLFGLVISLQPIPKAAARGKGSGPGTFRLLLTDSVMLSLALVMFCYGGTGFGITGWVNSYLGKVLGFAALASSSVLSLYHVGLTLGRIICSFIADRIGFPRLLAVCSLGSFAALGLAVATHNGAVTVAGFWLTGFFFSGLFPTSVAWASSKYPDRAGAASSTLITMNNLGAILVPQVMGGIAQGLGLGMAMKFAWGILWLLAFVGISFALMHIRGRSVGDDAVSG